METFNKKGFPIINFHDTYFEVKAIDFWEFRSFTYAEVVRIKYYKPEPWTLGMLSHLLYDEYEPFKLKIYKDNGGDWTYDAPPKEDPEFNAVIAELIARCGLNKEGR